MKKKHNAGRETGRSKGGLSIRTRIVLFCTAFVLLVLCIIYIVQIMMLGMFYEKTRFREMNEMADGIVMALGTPGLEQTCLERSRASHTCVLVFRTENGKITDCVVSMEGLDNCVIHKLTEQELADRFAEAEEGEGQKVYKLTADSQFIEAKSTRNRQIRAAVLIKSVEDKQGNTYALFLNAELSPMASVNATLNMQFSWLTVTIVCGAALASYLFARQISNPLMRMTAKAKNLAKGDYSPTFKEEGYKETVELAAALNYAAEEISKADNLRRELISNVSHDLRTPLTMISGYAEVMRDIPGENTPENVQIIIDESKHLSTLVNDILDLSKIESGVKKMQPERFSLTDTVREVMLRYSALKEHDGYDIVFAPDEDASVFADRTMIMQVIYNLTNNAINYTGTDKKVTVTQKNGTSEDASPVVRISVSDTGDGIAPEHIGSIWDRYYREDGPHKRATVGTGLGLSIVRDILQKHKAHFGVESAQGSGSTFWFELPREE